ncbi:MAG: MFS transporter [Blautia sp.]|jgi:OFA family oxalate/formate antiporter-like MFS transporter
MKKKIKYLISGVVSMLFLGLYLAWSVFVDPLQQFLQCSKGEISSVYTVFLACFCFGALFCGWYKGGQRPKSALAISAALVCMGLLGSSFAGSVGMLTLTYGILYGFGVGLGYNTVISAVVPWFPDHSGLAGGLLFMGVGMSAMIFAVPLSRLIYTFGSPFAFRLLSLCCFFAILISILILQPACEVCENITQSPGMNAIQMLKTRQFQTYFLWVIMILSGGMIVISDSAPLALRAGLTPAAAALGTSIFSIFNAASRLIMGRLYDKMGAPLSMVTLFSTFTASTLLLLLIQTKGISSLLYPALALMGFSYGGVPSVSSPFTYDYFGARNFAQNFSVIGLYTLAGSILGPFCFGQIFERAQSYPVSYLLLAVFAGLSLIMLLCFWPVRNANIIEK